jgi:hypothetical protein
MAYDKVVDSSVLDARLTQIANAIREKAGTSDSLAFPAAMAEAIAAIEAGGGISFGDFDEVTSGTFIPNEDITADYKIDIGMVSQKNFDCYVFVLFSAPPSFSTDGTSINCQWVNVMVTTNFPRGSSTTYALPHGAYLDSSGSVARVTSTGKVGDIDALGSSNAAGTPRCFRLDCTTSKMLPANMPYYWIAGVKRV